jgi:hypothetical protein
VKLEETARVIVPDEQVVACGIFRAGGSLTARASGFGEFSVRRREREEREASGLPFKRYMLLVVTRTRVHVFDARSRFTSWQVSRSLAVWDRSTLRVTMDPKAVTTRLTLEIPSEHRRLELEAPKARRSSSGEVARVLASEAAPADAGFPFPPRRPAADDTRDQTREFHSRAGALAVIGGATRLGAYAMPWIVVTRVPTGPTAQVSGFRELGSPMISVGYSIVIVLAGIAYLAGRREGSPRLIRTLGISSIIVFLIQFSITVSRFGSLRDALRTERILARISVGPGVWVELIGAILTLAGGLYAMTLFERAKTRPAAYASP